MKINDIEIGKKVTVIISYNIYHHGIIEATDSGHPLYLKDMVKVSSIGDPVSIEIIRNQFHPKIEALKNLAMRSHAGISFSPERRGLQILDDYSQQLTEDIAIIQQHNGDVKRYEDKYILFLSSWLSTMSRCMSSMITGPANFPVRRMEKINNSERNKYNTFSEFRQKVLNAITKTESTDIVKGSNGALEKMEAKLATLEANHLLNKELNKIVRDAKLTPEQKKQSLIEKCPSLDAFNLDWGLKWGFSLSGSKKILDLKKDIEAEKLRAQKYSSGNKEYQINGINVVENSTDNRIQLFFKGRPSPEMIQKLKHSAFKWSPKNICWQRQLTENAIWATKRILN